MQYNVLKEEEVIKKYRTYYLVFYTAFKMYVLSSSFDEIRH